MNASKVPSRTVDKYDLSTRIIPGQKAFSLFTRRSNHRPIHGFRLSPLAPSWPLAFVTAWCSNCYALQWFPNLFRSSAFCPVVLAIADTGRRVFTGSKGVGRSVVYLQI